MKKIFIKTALILTLLLSFNSISHSLPALADCANPTTAREQIQCGACDAAGSASCDSSAAPKTLNDTIKEIIDILSVIGGAAAVVMIVIAGFRFVTSGGNAESTKSARNTIIYAVIGLVVIALAQIIVHFTLNTVIDTNTGSPAHNSSGTNCPNGQTVC
jgi:hypothetical protein